MEYITWKLNRIARALVDRYWNVVFRNYSDTAFLELLADSEDDMLKLVNREFVVKDGRITFRDDSPWEEE